MNDVALLVLAGVFGSMLGSFLNVVIHRLPRRESIVWPGSHCPACEASIRWYDNVPILSWLILLGRCRSCRERISPRYLFVEALTATLTVAVAWRFLLEGEQRNWLLFVAALCFVAALLAAALIDLAHRIIPDRITKPGMFAAPVLSLLAPGLHRSDLHWLSTISPGVAALLLSLLGILVGAGSIWLMGVIGKAVFKKEAMGFGDVKFMGMVGGFVGPLGVLYVVLIACVIGAVVGTVSWLITRSHYIPFGPFLALGAAAVLFYRDHLHEFLTVTYPSLFRQP